MADRGLVRDFAVGPFAQSAAAWLANPDSRQEREPNPAATVVLLRGSPLEVFMIERAATMEFAPSTWVFPGGRVDSGDSSSALPERGEEHLERMSARLQEPLGVVRAWVGAAARELFEEAGVLLASEPSRTMPISALDESWQHKRAQLEAREMSWADVLGHLELRLELLEPVDRWITPPFEARRYDTVFFLAALPSTSRAEAVTREAQRGTWVQPQEMLDAADRGEVQLLPPTRTRLVSLVPYEQAETALASARAGGVIHATRPWPVQGAAGPFLRAEVNP